MIEIAKKNASGVEFLVRSAEEMEFEEEFDVIFCNSAFQWFNPYKALEKCFKALREGGRIGIQAPAKENYCPNFIKAVGEVRESEIGEIFAHFRSPWFFLESEEEYVELFESFGFRVVFSDLLPALKGEGSP